jgi:membrane fusion protein (multidrug efflux system)
MNSPAIPAGPSPTGNPARTKALLAVVAVIAVCAIAYGVYWALVLNHFESTDNAYVQADVVQLTPQVTGTVVAIQAEDTDRVKAGQWLVRLDAADAKVALEAAQADLAQAVRQVRTLYANNSTLQAQIAQHAADVERSQSELQKAQDDVARRTPLLASGAVGAEEVQHAQAQVAALNSALGAARSGLVAAQNQLAANRVLTEGTLVAQHPSVQRAAVRVREAFLALQRTEIVAPVDGFVAKRTVQLGARVQAGAPLMAVVALDRVWVEANFKESQLQNLRIGQPVHLVADVYGKKAAYHGTIEGFGAGTGAAFALLPAQNATGNWIKVVQRLPVRIRLDPKELAKQPLRVGLSMEAEVDVSHTDGALLADSTAESKAVQTAVFTQSDALADEAIRRIIAANGGGAQAAPLAH